MALVKQTFTSDNVIRFDNDGKGLNRIAGDGDVYTKNGKKNGKDRATAVRARIEFSKVADNKKQLQFYVTYDIAEQVPDYTHLTASGYCNADFLYGQDPKKFRGIVDAKPYDSNEIMFNGFNHNVNPLLEMPSSIARDVKAKFDDVGNEERNPANAYLEFRLQFEYWAEE